MIAGGYLLFMQLHGYQHDVLADDFRFPAGEHSHAHEDTAIEQTFDSNRNEL